MLPTHIQEGFIPFRGYRTFYKVVGDLGGAGQIPLLTIHGTPVSHESLEPLAAIAEGGRPVIFYDQIGNGQSDRPDDPAMWNRALFVDEIEAVRHHLNLQQVHILGHSWGGALTMEYALRQPAGIATLILHSTFSSDAVNDADQQRLREELPADVQETIHKHEAEGTTSDPAYQKAQRVFGLRHVCRLDPWPEYLMRSLRNPPVGKVPDEQWDVHLRLGEITVPTLVTCGRYDFCTPATATRIANAIPGSELVIFEESSHYAHIEEMDRYLALINDFMARKEEAIRQ